MSQPPPLHHGKGKKNPVWIHVKKTQLLELCLVDRCHLKIEEMLSNNNIKKVGAIHIIWVAVCGNDLPCSNEPLWILGDASCIDMHT